MMSTNANQLIVSNQEDNYFESHSVHEMCPNRVEMKCIEGSARYDLQTRHMLGNFVTYKNLKHKFQPIGQYYKNICWLSETRRQVTKDCCDKFVKDKQHIEINFKYKSQIEKYNVCVGTPIICTQNVKPKNMFSMMEFMIDDIVDTAPFSFVDGNKNYSEFEGFKFKINNETFDMNKLIFCLTSVILCTSIKVVK